MLLSVSAANRSIPSKNRALSTSNALYIFKASASR